MVVLQSVQRDAHKRGVGDSEVVARFEVWDPNERKDLFPGGDEMLLNRGQTATSKGQQVDEGMPRERREAIAAYQVEGSCCSSDKVTPMAPS